MSSSLCSHLKTLNFNHNIVNLISTIPYLLFLFCYVTYKVDSLTIFTFLSPCRIVEELEAKLDYERVRREDLEGQLDEYRAETSHLNLQIEELSCSLRQTEGVRFCYLIITIIYQSVACFGTVFVMPLNLT